MNYGRKLLHILMAGAGMMICVIGISYKTGYFPGHSEISAYALIAIGAIISIFGLIKMKGD